MRRSALAAAGAAAAGGAAASLVSLASARSAPALSARDREVLRFALLLERMQSALYDQALRAGRLSGEPHQFARVVGGQEQAHVRYLDELLGTHGAGTPRFDFGDAIHANDRFVALAITLEGTAVAAYNGEAENVSRVTLRSLARVMSVESRHVAWARAIAGKLPAPVAVDRSISAAAAMKAIRPFMA